MVCCYHLHSINRLLLLLLWPLFGYAEIIKAKSMPMRNVQSDVNFMHPNFNNELISAPMERMNDDTRHYLNMGQQFVEQQINRHRNNNIAKNTILFLGDGMSMATLAAARMIMNGSGEERTFSFEKFPFVGMSKTYCVNAQVADSACTSTAYLSGVKANYGTIGVNAHVRRHDCVGGLDQSRHTVSIAKWALDAGKSVGLVTTTRVTHASPAGVYAHTANRDWESNEDVLADNCTDPAIDDIAKQLLFGEVGSRLKVIFGGGRREFRDKKMKDEEGYSGRRTDKRDLINEWLNNKTIQHRRAYVWNKELLNNIEPNNVDAVLGLFDESHCKYNYEIDGISDTAPTLSEMTDKAIKILSTNKNGYFLFVEGGRIDHAHHDTFAHIALDETRQFSRTIGMAQSMVDADDTLIVVTADHGHTMTYSGYGVYKRGSNIFGTGGRSDIDNLPFLKLSYANGQGYYLHKPSANRTDPTNLQWYNVGFLYPATIPRASESHSGDDVAVYAIGPYAHLFRGVFEENSIPHMMAYAACIGPGLKACQ